MSTVILCRKCQCLKGLENIDRIHINDWCAILFFGVMNNFDKKLCCLVDIVISQNMYNILHLKVFRFAVINVRCWSISLTFTCNLLLVLLIDSVFCAENQVLDVDEYGELPEDILPLPQPPERFVHRKTQLNALASKTPATSHPIQPLKLCSSIYSLLFLLRCSTGWVWGLLTNPPVRMFGRRISISSLTCMMCFDISRTRTIVFFFDTHVIPPQPGINFNIWWRHE